MCEIDKHKDEVQQELKQMDFDSASKVEEMIVKLDQNCKLAYGDDYCKQFDSKFKAIIGRASHRK